jgi:hypothetical protein
MRRLVTVRTVSEIRPIKGADNIELAIIDGWQCVIKKGEFKVGDKGLYFEVDSFVPAKDPRFWFLEKSFTMWNNHYGARIRTIKLRGEISQGLLLPLKEFPEVNVIWASVSEQDCSGKIGVLKWDREVEGTKTVPKKLTWLGRKVKKLKYTKLKPFILWFERKFPYLFERASTQPFPSFIPKTDEERIQNLINKIDVNDGTDYETSVKVDGSSMTVYHNKSRTGVCSRNLDLREDKNDKFWITALKDNIPHILKSYGKNIALQGELLGPGIQGNKEKLEDYSYYIYKIYLIDERRYASTIERQQILGDLANLGYNAKTVPFLEITKLSRFKTIDDFLAYAEGPSLNAGSREGVVFTKLDGSKGFKVISNTYLLKHGE